MNRVIFGLLVSFLALTVSGCCTDPVNGESYLCFGEPSDQEEAQIGASYAPSFIAESGGLYPDRALHDYLNHIVIDKMARHTQRPNLPWEFHILNTSQINAFALPGGQVFVTRGLLARLDSEAQFAHLMGHELGHVTHKHSVRGQTRATLFGLLVGAVGVAESSIGDPDSPQYVTTAVSGLGQLTLLKFSRDQELQSDCRGVDYAVAAGYDPREGKKTFEMFLALKQQAGQGESLIDGLLSTHPLDSTRIEQIDAYIAETQPELPQGLVVNEPHFQDLMTDVRGAQAVYDDHDRAMALVDQAQEGNLALLDQAETLLRSCAQRLPAHAPFPVGLGVVALTRDDFAAAEAHFDRGVQLDPQLFMAVLYRGVARERRGRDDAAAADFTRAHELFDAHPLPCYLLGSISEKRGNSADAVGWYERALERSAEGSAIATKSKERLDALQQGASAA